MTSKYLTIDAKDFDPNKLHMNTIEFKKINISDDSDKNSFGKKDNGTTYGSGTLVYDGVEHWSVIEPECYTYGLIVQKISGKRGLLTQLKEGTHNYRFRKDLTERVEKLACEQARAFKKTPEMIVAFMQSKPLINPPDESKGYADATTFINIRPFTRFYTAVKKDGTLINTEKGETGIPMTDVEVRKLLSKKTRFWFIPKIRVTYLYSNGTNITIQMYATEITVLSVETMQQTQTLTPQLVDSMTNFYARNPDALKKLLQDLQKIAPDTSEEQTPENSEEQEPKESGEPEEPEELEQAEEPVKPAVKNSYAGKAFQSLRRK